MHKATIVGASIVCASIAFAAQQQSGSQPQRPRGGVGVPDPQGPGQPMGSLAGGGCTEGPPLEWFTVVHEMPECYVRSNQDYGHDVNADGELEYIGDPPGYGVVVGGHPVVGGCVSVVQVLAADGAGTVVTHSCVLSSEVVGLHMVGAPHFATDVDFYDQLYRRDMDGDGDLDLLGSCYSHTASGGDWVALWIENTGYEHNPPLAADVNGDGAVNGIDLASVLTAWSAQE